MIRRPAGSMTKLLSEKKSTPSIGRETLATTNLCWKGGAPSNSIVFVRSPKVLMGVPFAALKEELTALKRSFSAAGNTEMSAPESTRKSRPLILSRRERVCVDMPAADATKGDRPCRFPVALSHPSKCTATDHCIGKHWLQTENV